MAIEYHRKNYNPLEVNPYSIDSISTEMIPIGARVLDIGCATGYIADYLQKHKKCYVFGVESNPEQAQLAKKVCSFVFIGNIEDREVQQQIDQYINKESRFDCVFMSQIIEHLNDPWRILDIIPRWIKKDGCLVISTCNIAHWKIRKELLKGNWLYQEFGILDRSHLRFFTYETFQQILLERGYQILEEDYTMNDFSFTIRLPFYKRLICISGIINRLLGKTALNWYKSKYRNLLAYQMAFKCFYNRSD